MKNLDKFIDIVDNTLINKSKVEYDKEIFKLSKKAPYGIPSGVLDYYVERTNGKTSTSKWDEFEDL